MDVLMVCSEVAPVAKVGGVADAVAALAKTLSRLGHQVTVAIPRYQVVSNSGLMVARRLKPIKLEIGDEVVEAIVYDGRLGSEVELLLIDIPELYDRPGIYGEGGVDYPDNARRYGLFCRALVEVVAKRERDGRPFDVVHAHDWHAALLPYLLRDEGPRTILTIHNAAHQGVFESDAMDRVGLDREGFHPAGLEFYGKLNLLKAGVVAADVVTTVSPNYAREIVQPATGCGLDGVFNSRGVAGVLNGIDYAVWSPSTDPHVVSRYDAEDVVNKRRCKTAMLDDLGFTLDPERPLLVALGRVCEQKGSDVLARAVNDIVATGAQLLIAGGGDPALEKKLEEAATRASEDVRYLGEVGEAMCHRLISAADAVLLPSRFEPCGLVQQYGQRYGAVPIVCSVGGLVDTVVDCDARGETGTGFLFDEPTTTALVGAVQRAVALMATPHWGVVRRRVMRLDLSWERSARRYARLYRAPEAA